MAIRVEHELHERRRSRNSGVGILLLGVVGIVFGLTVVKVLNLENIAQFERFDHVARPLIEPDVMESMTQAQAAQAEAALEELSTLEWDSLSDQDKAIWMLRLEQLGLTVADVAAPSEASE